MGTGASLSKAEIQPSSSASQFISSTRNFDNRLSKDQHLETISHLSLDQQCNEYTRALNTIQRQQDELEELAQQLQQRDQDLRLIRDLRTREEPATLDESLKLRDLRIRKLEEDADCANRNLTKQKARYKRKTRDILTQLVEVRQSNTIRIMELRQEVHRLNLENRQLKERLGLSDSALVPSLQQKQQQQQQQTPGASGQTSTTEAAAAAAADTASGLAVSANKSLIVELSTQLNHQADQLSSLRHRLAERDARIAQLESRSSAVTAATGAGKALAAGKQDVSLAGTNGGGDGAIVKRSLYSSNQQQKQQQLRNLPPARIEKLQAAPSDELSIRSSLISAATGDDEDDDKTEMGDDDDDNDDEPGTNRSYQYYAGDADSIYSEDTLLSVEIQHQQGRATLRTPGGQSNAAGGTIIFDAYKQRTIDKLLQD